MDEKTKYYRDLAVEFTETDISLTKMAKREGTTRQTLAKNFKKLGFEIVNKQNQVKFDEHIFDSIDTEEKAYWLGFIFADGYIASNPIRDDIKKSRYIFEISLKGSDVNHLLKLAKFINLDENKVKISDATCNGKKFKRCRLYISNKHLWETLYSYGCTPKKSLTLNFPDKTIFKDQSLIRHFIRGYFDGDGCFSRHICNTIVTPSVSFLGTPGFLNNIIKYSEISGTIRYDKRRSENTLILDYHKEECVTLINYLYSNCSIYLDRKYELYEFFKCGSRSVKEFAEFQQTKIGEDCDVNPEVITEIKESVTP